MTYSLLRSLCSLRLIIAEIPISPAELFSCLGIVLFGMGAYSLLLRIQVDRKKLAAGPPQADIKPSPFVVKEVEKFVLREECDRAMECVILRTAAVEREYAAIREEMKRDSNRLSQEGEARSRRLHERIDAVSASLGADIKRLPAEIFEMLRNLKNTFTE